MAPTWMVGTVPGPDEARHLVSWQRERGDDVAGGLGVFPALTSGTGHGIWVGILRDIRL